MFHNFISILHFTVNTTNIKNYSIEWHTQHDLQVDIDSYVCWSNDGLRSKSQFFLLYLLVCKPLYRSVSSFLKEWIQCVNDSNHITKKLIFTCFDIILPIIRIKRYALIQLANMKKPKIFQYSTVNQFPVSTCLPGIHLLNRQRI